MHTRPSHSCYVPVPCVYNYDMHVTVTVNYNMHGEYLKFMHATDIISSSVNYCSRIGLELLLFAGVTVLKCWTLVHTHKVNTLLKVDDC